MSVSFILPVILFAIVWIVSRIIFYKKNKPINKTREIFINLFFVYFLILVNLTLFKYGYLMLDYDPEFYINYIPFIETIKMFTDEFSDIHYALYNVIGNILLFLPLGFCIPLFFNKKNKLNKVILYGLLASLTIELLQLFSSNNITDIDDIIFNTLGSIIGFIINNLISRVVFGKNIDANTIEINFKGTKYTENLTKNEYFIVPFPNFENVDDLTDLFNFFEGKEILDLQIKFYYKDGRQCTNMKFSY